MSRCTEGWLGSVPCRRSSSQALVATDPENINYLTELAELHALDGDLDQPYDAPMPATERSAQRL